MRRIRVDLNRIHNLAETARERLTTQTQRARASAAWYRIDMASRDSADVYLYDMIGDWGVTAQDFVRDLNAVKAQSISLYVNSEGGEVFDGLAIFEAIARHPATVRAQVDGLAASAASFIVQAADEIVMAKRAKMMIHDARGGVWGPARDMRAMADLLDELSDTIADIYSARAGGSRASWREAMRAASGGPDGTWYDANAAVKAGLADAVEGDAAPASGEPADVDVTGINATRRECVPGGVHVDADAIPSWDSTAFLRMIEDIENPAPALDGRAMLDALDLP